MLNKSRIEDNLNMSSNVQPVSATEQRRYSLNQKIIAEYKITQSQRQPNYVERNLTEQCFVSACEGIDESERQKAGWRMAPMIQFGSLVLILWQAIELSIRQTWNIGAAEAAADEVCLSSQWRRNATFQQSSQSLNMRCSDIINVAAEK